MFIPVFGLFPFWDWCISVRVLGKGVGRGGSEGSDNPRSLLFFRGEQILYISSIKC